tara:strand:+ start:513 stop:1040 length:528 start_codon:yes stop_codon:yes gene_type:complete
MASRQRRLARQQRLRKIENRKGIVAARSATQSPELKAKFAESKYQDNAAAAGVKNVNSQNDIAKIDAYLSSTGSPTPTPEPEPEPAPEPEMPDFDKMLSDMSASFAQQMQENEDNYMAALLGLQDSLKSSQNPLMRNPVLGVRFAGQNNNARANNSAFNRTGQRIRGIATNQLNI